jgi:proline iminopeptidase
VRGIFALRRAEVLWYYQEGASWLFPDLWEEFLAPIPEAERGDLIAAYRKRLVGSDRAAQLAAARAWSLWEGQTITLLPDPAFTALHGDDDFALAFARIENHYFVHAGWLEEGQLIRDAHKLAGIPGVIVQGRYDVATPAKTAWDLHRAWPEADFTAGRRRRPCLQRARHPAAAGRRHRPLRLNSHTPVDAHCV